MSVWAYAVVLAALALFGPVLLSVLWLRPAGVADFSKLPVFIAAWMLALPAICCVLFVYYLFNRHRIEMVRDSGTLCFYKRGGSKTSLRVEKQEIAGFAIGEEWYRPSRGGAVKNFVLSVVCRDGRRIGLCKTTDEGLVRGLAAEMEQILGLG